MKGWRAAFRHGEAVGIKQEVTDLVRALAWANWPEVDRLLAEIDRTGWQGSAPVLGAAFALMVHRRFEPGQDVREITAFVAEARSRYEDGGKLPALEMEAMIRAALGEADLADNVAPDVAFEVQLAVMTTLLQDADMTDAELDEFISDVAGVAARHL